MAMMLKDWFYQGLELNWDVLLNKEAVWLEKNGMTPGSGPLLRTAAQWTDSVIKPFVSW